MEAAAMQSTLFRAMTDPGFYPHEIKAVQQRETHISRVFLTGHFVYKIKKPVDLGFLDFSTLEKRLHFCMQEVKLNRRLTRGIYQDVAAICFDGERFRIDDSDQTVEYAVKMRQLPEKRTMEHLLSVKAIGPPEIERLAAKLARFHDRYRTDDHGAIRSHVRAACAENFRQIRPHAGDILDAEKLKAVETATIGFLNRNKRLFDYRITTGRICDGHGDLRTEHVYYTADEKIQILDCIEFNDYLRILDVASDMAFLAMDLDYRSAPDLCRHLLKAYCQYSGDFHLLSLMDFYKSYRAMVRCKVNCILLKAGGHALTRQAQITFDARRYLDLAHDYCQSYTRPTLWVFCGLPASGKSALSAKLGESMCVQRFNSDRVRKQLFGIDPQQPEDGPVDRGIYSTEATVRVYQHLHDLAGQALLSKASVVLDATYGLPARRQQIRQLAKDRNARIFFVECAAPDTVLVDRLRTRERSLSVSDARPKHFEALKARFKPLTEIPPAQHIRLNTTQPPEACMETIFFKSFLAQ